MRIIQQLQPRYDSNGLRIPFELQEIVPKLLG